MGPSGSKKFWGPTPRADLRVRKQERVFGRPPFRYIQTAADWVYNLIPIVISGSRWCDSRRCTPSNVLLDLSSCATCQMWSSVLPLEKDVQLVEKANFMDIVVPDSSPESGSVPRFKGSLGHPDHLRSTMGPERDTQLAIAGPSWRKGLRLLACAWVVFPSQRRLRTFQVAKPDVQQPSVWAPGVLVAYLPVVGDGRSYLLSRSRGLAGRQPATILGVEGSRREPGCPRFTTPTLHNILFP
ncbi:hypothetical protein B0H11DRAFT_1925547 [Mycena galericulata]|nr:hypothetical protein B0H11DRAFT_1925547 [Mycena galericulata]